MMTAKDIQMCVADVMQDDDIEDIAAILRMLNHEYESSWRMARGSEFTTEEVQAALQQLMAAKLVTPCAEQPPFDGCRPIAVEKVGTVLPWKDIWFHLEAPGREAVHRWWKTEGQARFPLTE